MLLLEKVLSSAGHIVRTARSGAEAIERFKHEKIEAIVSDVMMEGMDGLQLLRAVREHDLDVPVVLISAGPSLDAVVQALEHGAYRYLSKPLDIPYVLRVMSSAISLYRLAQLKRQALEWMGAFGKSIGDQAGLLVRFDRALQSLWVAYQPIIRWSTREVIAFEALARSNEPALPDPAALIDAAERLGRQHDLGRSIRAAALEGVGKTTTPLLFLNINPHELEDDFLLSELSPLTRSASQIVLEITERSSLDMVKDVRLRVARLRELGFRIALDDLGAGYAGLNALAILEPDYIKLDRSLICDIDRSPTKQKLVHSINNLCADMGIFTIAEGVEMRAELDALADLGCDLFQGYLIAEPAPVPSDVRWIQFEGTEASRASGARAAKH